jgi:medium-chain acyl-[acyl-carrier-protein] hydrolase
MTKNLMLSSEFSITSADTDMYSRIRLGSLVSMLIQSAISSADKLGFGHLTLIENKLFWVLSRLTLEIIQPLEWYDNVEVITWPKDIKGLLYLRDFEIKKGSNILARATSGWLAVDMTSKRPKNINFTDLQPFTRLRDRHAIKDLPVKLDQISDGDSFKVLTSYFDMDMNKHVTSTRYIDWMMDTFPLEFHRSNYPTSLAINYLRETLPGDSINLIRENEGENLYHFEGINQGSNNSAFRGRIQF